MEEPKRPGIRYHFSLRRGALRSTDGGLTWAPIVDEQQIRQDFARVNGREHRVFDWSLMDPELRIRGADRAPAGSTEKG